MLPCPVQGFTIYMENHENRQIGRGGNAMSFKVAVIGAGSVGFTREIIRDLLSVPEFYSIELAFTDINEKNLEMAVQLVQRDIDYNSIPIKIQATTDRREAFRDAKYVMNFVRIGMLDAFRTDIETVSYTHLRAHETRHDLVC